MAVRMAYVMRAHLRQPCLDHKQVIIQEAAALWESLSQNHPFIDGNKRVAFAVTYTFLAINGIKIKSNSEDILVFIDNLYLNQKFEYKELEQWLRITTI